MHTIQRPIELDQPLGTAMVQRNIFRQKTNAAARLGMAERLPKQTSVAMGGQHKTHRQMDRGALPGPVWAQKTKNFSLLHLQRKIIQRA